MRIQGRIQRLLIFFVAAAVAHVSAFAQGRGRGAVAGATNGFYRFNYGAEEMQPIAYPAQPPRTKTQPNNLIPRGIKNPAAWKAPP